jgi:23S rRNA (cytosine1962-C5)-methyltransferase
VREASREAPAGTVGVVFDRKNRFLAAGLLDPEGPIRLRVLVHGGPAPIGPDLFRDRLQSALELRAPLLQDARTTGYRVLSGENDGVPGLVADRYGEGLVLKIYSPSWISHLREVVPVLLEACAPSLVVLLPSRRVAGSALTPPVFREPVLLHGELPEGGALPFRESGLHLEAHPLQGQKTGFYLDQRENRARVEEEVARMAGEVAPGGRGPVRVLNAFSYTGAFSLRAARGGAEEVLSLDAAGGALRQAERHFRLNRTDPAVARCLHRTMEGEAFEALAALARNGERFQAVILDPPSFAAETRQRNRALAAYRSLTRLALPLLDRGGLLVQASCSSRVEANAFFSAVHEAARTAGRPLVELARTGHPLDHPVTFPEGAYLKCLFARG